MEKMFPMYMKTVQCAWNKLDIKKYKLSKMLILNLENVNRVYTKCS